jgi:hypothetical protein
MRRGAFLLSSPWDEVVNNITETGMGYTIVSVTLRDGRRCDQVLIDSGYVSRVRGLADIPFSATDIAGIAPDHRKWDWKETP